MKIRIIGTEDNKDKAFSILMDAENTVTCLEWEDYFVSQPDMMRLKKENVRFKIIK